MALLVWIFAGVIGFVVLSYAWLQRRQFGKRPSAERQKQFLNSPQYDPEKKQFRNRDPRNFQADFNFPLLLKGFLFGKQIRVPTEPLPAQSPDLQDFLLDDESFKWIWLGHSSLYWQINGLKVLTDPVYAHSASPFWFVTKRFQKPVLSLKDTPTPDIVLISHDHYDHLDAGTIRFFAKDSPQFITALGVGSKLEGWGIPREKIIELDWHESAQFKNLKITAAPVQHFSGRGLFDQRKTLWASWIFASSPRSGKSTDALKNIYFSADSGYAEHFKEIGRLYGPFDHAFLECGQYNHMWHFVHLLPAEIIEAAQDLGVKKFSPIHWGMFNLSMHDWFEPVELTTRLAERNQIQVWHPQLGEVVRFSRGPRPGKWWQAHPDFKKRGSML